MRALLLHCKNYQIQIESLATRPKNVKPEVIHEKEQRVQKCVVILLTVESSDKIKQVVPLLREEIIKMCKDVGHLKVVLVPFAHLSRSLADSDTTCEAITEIENGLKKEFSVFRAHFGSHKELLLHMYGHPGNVRYREF